MSEQPAKKARTRLREAIDRACVARGEAQFTYGYRTAKQGKLQTDEDQRLYQKQMAQFKFCELAEDRVESAIRAFARAVRAETR